MVTLRQPHNGTRPPKQEGLRLEANLSNPRGCDYSPSLSITPTRSQQPPQCARHHVGWALLPGLVSVKGCTDFADVCAVNADSLVKLFAGDAEGLRPVSDVRGHLGVDLVRVEGSSLFWMLEGYGACNDV